MCKKINPLVKFYEIFIVVLAIISVAFTILDFSGQISLYSYPFNYIDNIIWIIFVFDYLIGLLRSKSKKEFFETHLFDLLAIIPISSFFSMFRLARITRFARIFRVFRMAGVIGKIKSKLKSFLSTNGFIYLIYSSIAIILIASGLYSNIEKIPFGDAVWWSLTTATTVGYGDISPKTVGGKAIAIVLMFIGVGFVGMLTSTLTTYFTVKKDTDEKNSNKDLLIEIENLKSDNKEIKRMLKTLLDENNNKQGD